MADKKIVEKAKHLGTTYYGKDSDGDRYGYDYEIKLENDDTLYKLRTFHFLESFAEGLKGKEIRFSKTLWSGYSDFDVVEPDED